MTPRWPWWVAGGAAALWLLLAIAMLAALRMPDAFPPAAIVAGAIALGLAAPVAVIVLAALHLRETGAGRAERSAMLSDAAWLTDHRLDEAGTLLAAFESRFAALGGRVVGLAAASTALEAAAEAAEAAGSRLEAVIPGAAAQANMLRSLLAASDTNLQRQLGETETLLAALWDRAAGITAHTSVAAATATAQIEAITIAADAASAALTGPLAALETASAGALDRNTAAAAATRVAVDANAAQLAASVADASASLGRIGDGATARAAGHLATLQAAATQLTGEMTHQADRYRIFIEQLERGFAILDARLVTSAAAGKAGLDSVAAGMMAARDAVNSLDPPITATREALAVVEGQVAGIGNAATATLAALDIALPAAAPQIADMTAALGALHASASGLAAPIAGGVAAIDDAGAGLVAAQDGLDAAAARVTTELAAARTVVTEIETMAGSTALAAASQLADVFGRVRDVARQTAGTMRTALAEVVAEADTALATAGSTSAETAFASPIRAALGDLERANARAADAAQAAAERITARLLALTTVIADVESRLAAAEDAQGSRLRADIATRSATLLASMEAAAIDISGLLSADLDETAWGKWLAGERGLFTRRAVRLVDTAMARAIAGHWRENHGFRELATRYIGEFEALVARVLPDREGRGLALALLSSDTGKLYIALTQATGLLR